MAARTTRLPPSRSPNFSSEPHHHMNFSRRHFLIASAQAGAAALIIGCSKKSQTAPDGRPILRIGFFPNLTHAQALVGVNETATKDKEGRFESRTGAKIEWYQFTAGPLAIEALENHS